MRPDKHNYYLNIAEAVAARGTCLRRNYGTVIVKNDEIIATGYTGTPRGIENCCDIKNCFREKRKIKSGEHYELCRSVHSEANAIISAPRKDMIDSILYLVGIDAETKIPINTAASCIMCKKLIINAGIKISIARIEKNSYRIEKISDWIKDPSWLLFHENKIYPA